MDSKIKTLERKKKYYKEEIEKIDERIQDLINEEFILIKKKDMNKTITYKPCYDDIGVHGGMYGVSAKRFICIDRQHYIYSLLEKIYDDAYKIEEKVKTLKSEVLEF